MAGKPRIPAELWPNIVTRYLAGEDCAALGSAFGVKRGAIYQTLRRSGIEVEKRGGSPPVSEEMRLEALRRYTEEKQGATTVARQLGINKRTVYNLLNNAGLGTRPRSDRVEGALAVRQKRPTRFGHKRGPHAPCREDAFATLTDESAFWLGYLITDGCVHQSDGRTPRVILRQSRAHREVCEQLRTFLGSSTRISDVEVATFGKLRKFSVLQVTSQRLADDLLRWGIGPAKTGRVRAVAELEDNAQFWRGVIEGDGSVYENRVRMNSSSPALVGQYRRFLRRRGLGSASRLQRNAAGVWAVEVAHMPFAGVLASLLYDTSHPCGITEKRGRANKLRNRV